MNNMEIKQGDKVKVSEDAPKVYMSSVNNLFKYHVCKVEETDGDSAKIRYTDIGIDRWLAIPTKYLVKVDAEAKEAKFKVGDKVRCVLNSKVYCIEGRTGKYHYALSGFNHDIHEDYLELYTKSTEQTEAEKKPNVGSIKIPVEVDLSDSYWDAYAADLAKEVALKVANKYNDPEQAAEYAVSVAKAVVEGLKRE